jgi:hypothetical protein
MLGALTCGLSLRSCTGSNTTHEKGRTARQPQRDLTQHCVFPASQDPNRVMMLADGEGLFHSRLGEWAVASIFIITNNR